MVPVVEVVDGVVAVLERWMEQWPREAVWDFAGVAAAVVEGDPRGNEQLREKRASFANPVNRKYQ